MSWENRSKETSGIGERGLKGVTLARGGPWWWPVKLCGGRQGLGTHSPRTWTESHHWSLPVTRDGKKEVLGWWFNERKIFEGLLGKAFYSKTQSSSGVRYLTLLGNSAAWWCDCDLGCDTEAPGEDCGPAFQGHWQKGKGQVQVTGCGIYRSIRVVKTLDHLNKLWIYLTFLYKG